MGLFSKREPCPICGGKVKGLLTWKVGGKPVCDDCYGTVDLPDGVVEHMSIEDFKGYMMFRKENDLLRQEFHETQQIDFGWFDTKFVFDVPNRLMCLDKNLNKTIFQGSEITSFRILEDASPLFEGTSAGLRCYASSVPDRARAMAPQIQQWLMQREMQRELERMRDKNDSQNHYHSTPTMHIPEPFKKFNVEIRFNHPYWKTFKADMDGPTFNTSYPDINDYLLEYQQRVTTIEELARALAQIAFPGKAEQTVASVGGTAAAAAVARSAPVAAVAEPVDAVAEIQRYKKLVEQGILTEEEFAAKKRQLLGI